jgi:small ligand-binding sensory domain FIST
MQSSFAVSAVYEGRFDETKLRDWAQATRRELSAPGVTLGLVFVTTGLMDDAEQLLEVIRVHAQVPLLLGCSSPGLIAGGKELEEAEGIALGLYYLPGADLQAYRFTQAEVEEANGPAYWHHETGVDPDQCNGWLVFADPFHLDAERWLASWDEAYRPAPILGGLAGGDFANHRTQVYWNGDVFEEGGVALNVGGQVRLASVISQGCTPVGETWTITRAERNLIHHIGNRPAYEVLLETYNNLSAEEQQKTQGHLFVGLVVNEYLEDFGRGDFLIRNLLGADPKTGSLAVGARPRTGQTVQFQRRDPDSASEDLAGVLTAVREDLANYRVLGGCLCSCNGRGKRMFGRPHHDAELIQSELAPPGLAGFFCSGEIGPVGQRNFLHGFTAPLALFVQSKETEPKD